ncbi:MAG TPA: GNAT family N-acetyltransferase [Myxococcaceae bacterium]|nr:GNAT family N-acetyltransferase [Myxococcaceae bacterium]
MKDGRAAEGAGRAGAEASAAAGTRAARNEVVQVQTLDGRVEEIRDRAAFVALEREWNALVAESDDQIFYRHEFLRVWIDNFAPRAQLRALVIRGRGGRLEAALPLLARPARMYGVPVRELSSAANPHSCRFDLLARDPPAAASAFLAHLAQDRSWDVLRITDVPEGGKARALLASAEARGFLTGTWESLRSPYIPLPATRAELLARLDGKFKANLRRRRRKLEEKGRVEVKRIEGGDALERALEEGFALERSGWKGKGGTAIVQDEATRGFYSELARIAAELGALALYSMRVDGRPVAFHYALEYGGRYLLLKPAYDESIKECSPGQLLVEEVLAASVERRLAEFDFLGPDMVWKRDWTDRLRPHHWVFIFRDGLLGRALREAKFRWIPAIKEVVNRCGP